MLSKPAAVVGYILAILAASYLSHSHAQSAYEIPSIEVMASQPTIGILPVAPVSRTGPTTVWQSGNYTYIEEPDNQTTVYQSGKFTYITPQRGPSTVCQTIGKFTYCN